MNKNTVMKEEKNPGKKSSKNYSGNSEEET